MVHAKPAPKPRNISKAVVEMQSVDVVLEFTGGALKAARWSAYEEAAATDTAQVKSKVAQARYEAKVAADAELLAARKKLVERRYEVAEWERETKKVTTRCEDLQMRLDAVLQEHRNTLIGVREDLHLEKLLATLDMEKATREKLRQVFEEQQQDLTRAQERVEALDAQVANYQKTETVLAQSVAHLQHRFASKDQQRAASVEHVQRELVDQHEQEMVSMREELAIARRTEQMAQNQLQSLRKELKVLRDSSQQMMNSQESVVTHEQELKAKIAKLETEKAVLQSKAEQVQKADAQLRSQVHAHSEEIAALRLEKESLQRDNKELGEIASDLMQMAERQHADNVKRGVSPLRLTGDAAADTLSSTHDKDGVFLQKRKKRLRLSLG
ncbi:hypothetical protein BBO99_00005650 [Phytophthora kernoviae]|uniref:Uncharacterized protein n=2 Tax=Phytophthora kernoviae TaxID=325452 RepID=A0A3R7K1A9_9STRA|nr:hypothetical protein G195_005562 [Phytophthora kernoviae 00238/432]KAG2519600.1 hypothetical protein JM16_006018 [Phytophthora kernoviae]KAG2520822.1 hypothetical protein JM18_006931 [Phytophthora kernoviae]RLN44956.1 hypothetical protein BBI17_005710 [Phytophthora kernoviae]RLN78883.1 hypothetical protein BBO99_00005650 [Phytophthora kernoviae]